MDPSSIVVHARRRVELSEGGDLAWSPEPELGLHGSSASRPELGPPSCSAVWLSLVLLHARPAAHGRGARLAARGRGARPAARARPPPMLIFIIELSSAAHAQYGAELSELRRS
ncbi:hypothetical protein Dimus_014236 [Dionaea muscipula]